MLNGIKAFFSCLFASTSNLDPTHIIEKLYRTIDGVYISHCERERLQINDTSFIYGEITPAGFSDMLQLAQPHPGDIFYDLGSGTGKAVFCAALEYDWKKCIGIEFLPGFYQVSQALLKNFLVMKEIQQDFSHTSFPIQFIHHNYLQVDFSDADIVFANASAFNPVLWGELELKLNTLKQGARVIVSTRQLDESHFIKLHQSLFPMSWGECTVFIYQKN